MNELGPLAIFDIDGVLADARHRQHHLGHEPKRWEAFFAAMDRDTVLEVGRDAVTDYAEGHTIVYLTGRPERYAETTRVWLHEHGFPLGAVVARRDQDHRPAAQMKIQAVRRLARQHEIAVIVDDDHTVVDILQEAGYPAELAAWTP